jgi:outer membrane protein assembly factor BamB
LTGSPVERWRVQTTAGDAPRVATGSGSVFATDNDQHLLSLDASTGQERWRVPLAGNGGTPVVVGDLLLVDDGDLGLLALDTASGKERWRFDARASHAAEAICGGQVIAGGKAGLFALDAESGQEHWSFLTGSPHGQPVTNGEIVVSHSADGVLYVVDAAIGRERWSVPFGGRGATPAVSAGLVFAAVERGRLGERIGTLAAFDIATGTERWSRALPERLQGSPIFDGSQVYLGVGDAVLAFAPETGDEIWRTAAGDLLSTPVPAGSSVYLAAGSGTPVDGTSSLLALDAQTGSKQWSISLGYVMVATPAIATGLLVAASADPYLGGSIVAFGE